MAETAFYLAMAFSVGEIASLCAADLYYIGCAAETDSQRLRSRQADALILMCVGCLVLYGVNALVPGLPEYLVNCAAGFVVGRVLFEMLRVEGNRGTAWCLAAAELLAVLLARFSPAGFYRTVTFVAVLGCVAAGVIMICRAPIINYYQVTEEAKLIAWELMDAISFIIIFQSMNSILTKGVLRAGGDTKFLMAGDILFLWVASVPLGALAGLVFHWPAFWIYTMLKIDQVIKCIWCVFRLKSGKWMKKISKA